MVVETKTNGLWEQLTVTYGCRNKLWLMEQKTNYSGNNSIVVEQNQ
jgi:hypothetical protein